MDSAPASRQPPPAWWPALACALAGAAVFQFFGNASRGYIDTTSLFYWWGYQWFNAGSETEHGIIVLAVSGWLFWRNLKNPETRRGVPVAASVSEWTEDPLAHARSHRDRGEGAAAPVAAMIAGLALHAVGFAAQQARLSIVALLVFAWGGLRLAGGRRWGAAAVFPLGFLVFAIPVNVLDTVGFALRMWVVKASAALAHVAGIGVLRSGTQLIAPDGRYVYDVVAECSGVRSLTALVALSALAGYLCFATVRRRAVLLLLCAPLVYLGNVARLAAIIFAAHLGGPAWGERAHTVMGFGVFAIVLGGLVLAVRAMERWWPERGALRPVRQAHGGQAQGPAAPERDGGQRTDDGRWTAEDGGQQTGDRGPLMESETPSASGAEARRSSQLIVDYLVWVAPAIIVGLALGEMVFLRRVAHMAPRGGAGVVLAADGRNPVDLPTFIGTQWIGQEAAVSAVEREILPKDTGFSRKVYFSHRDTSKQVLLSIVLSGRDRTSIHRPEICLVGQGRTITSVAEHAFQFPGPAGATHQFVATVLQVRREVPTARGPQVTPELVAYWFVSADAVAASHWERLARDAWNRVFHARADRWAYVLMQTEAADGEAAALTRMQAVLDGTLPAFQKPLQP